MSSCLETDIFLVNTVVGFKFSQHYSLPFYSAVQLDFFFKLSVPKHRMKYPKKKALPQVINNVQSLIIISVCPNSHRSKHALAFNV